MGCQEEYRAIRDLLENGLTPTCIADTSAIGRLQRFFEFQKAFDLPDSLLAYYSEGLLRPVVAKWHAKEDVSEEVAEIRRVLEEYPKVCEAKVIEDAKLDVEYLEAKQRRGKQLTQKQKEQLQKARRIVQTTKVAPSLVKKDMVREARESTKKFRAKKSVPSGTEKVTLTFTKTQYEAINKHFNEGHEAKDKKALASQIVAFLMQYVSKV